MKERQIRNFHRNMQVKLGKGPQQVNLWKLYRWQDASQSWHPAGWTGTLRSLLYMLRLNQLGVQETTDWALLPLWVSRKAHPKRYTTTISFGAASRPRRR